MERKYGLIDFSIGKFPTLLVSALIFLLLLSLQNFDSWAADGLRNISCYFGGFFRQLLIISESRETPDKSIVLLWISLAISICGFIIFLYTIPTSSIRDKYLKANAISSIFLLAASSAFFALIIAGGIYNSFILPAGDGRFSKIIAFIIQTDAGLSVSFCSLLMVEAYCLATTLKAISSYIFN